jgi:predicted naringenin-chalcone synthase
LSTLEKVRFEQESRPSAATPRAGAARLLGTGTAVPPNAYTQTELLDEFRISDPRVRAMFTNGAIARRHLELPPREPDGTRRMENEGELLAKHQSVGLTIGADAITRCLADTGYELDDVRYLCCVTSTGFLTPGFSAHLISGLGLSWHCSRLDVVGMGCNAGLNALAAVAGWATAHPGQLAVMACIEVCSAAYVFDGTMRTAVVNSLFGDGAAAVAVLAGNAEPLRLGAAAVDRPAPAVSRTSSCIVTDAIAAMRYDWDGEANKFSFFLDPEIPYVVGANVGRAVDRLLAGSGLSLRDIDHWIVHSGGKKVIDALRVNLGLTRHDVRHTTGVLRDFGNVSSASFLFTFQRLMAEGVVRRGDRGVMMTMGPGSTIELALLQW